MLTLVETRIMLHLQSSSFHFLPTMGISDGLFWIQLFCRFKRVGAVFLEPDRTDDIEKRPISFHTTRGIILPERCPLIGIMYLIQTPKPGFPGLYDYSLIGFINKTENPGCIYFNTLKPTPKHSRTTFKRYFQYEIAESLKTSLPTLEERILESRCSTKSSLFRAWSKFSDLHTETLSFRVDGILPSEGELNSTKYCILRVPGTASQLESIMFDNVNHISNMGVVISALTSDMTDRLRVGGSLVAAVKSMRLCTDKKEVFGSCWNLMIEALFCVDILSSSEIFHDFYPVVRGLTNFCNSMEPDPIFKWWILKFAIFTPSFVDLQIFVTPWILI